MNSSTQFINNHPDLLLVTWWLFLILMTVLCAFLLWLMLRGTISLKGLLDEETGGASVSRFQLLLFSLIVAVGLFLYIGEPCAAGYSGERADAAGHQREYLCGEQGHSVLAGGGRDRRCSWRTERWGTRATANIEPFRGRRDRT
jgi:hypothetical protein